MLILKHRLIHSLGKMAKRELSDYESFQKVLNESKNIAVLTGAGVSSESGIPVFRGAGGFWKRYRSQDLATPKAFASTPALVWEFYNYRRNIAFNALPNNAHKALARFEVQCLAEGKQFTLITQNVDGLHQRAGSKNVIELHGVLSKVICTKCHFIEENYDNPICEAFRDRTEADPAQNFPLVPEEELPKCKKCQQLARPYIVWFGESLDTFILSAAEKTVSECDIFLVIGTSSVVYPAAMFAPLVANRGKPVAEFNINEKPADDKFKYYFKGQCGTTVPKALGVKLD